MAVASLLLFAAENILPSHLPFQASHGFTEVPPTAPAMKCWLKDEICAASRSDCSRVMLCLEMSTASHNNRPYQQESCLSSVIVHGLCVKFWGRYPYTKTTLGCCATSMCTLQTQKDGKAP